jgi:hypothetical protein
MILKINDFFFDHKPTEEEINNQIEWLLNFAKTHDWLDGIEINFVF